MSWNSLAYAVPAVNFLTAITATLPFAHKLHRHMPTSPLSEQVKAIIRPILTAENVEGSEHYDAIQELLNELPQSNQSAVINAIFDLVFIKSEVVDAKTSENIKNALKTKESSSTLSDAKVSVTYLNKKILENPDAFPRIQDLIDELPTSPEPRTIDSLLRHKFKVTTALNDYMPVGVAGIGSIFPSGQYFVGVHPSTDPKILPWAIAHEVSHILNEDNLELACFAAASSLAGAFFSTYIMDWSLPTSLAVTLAAQTLGHTAFSRITEAAADDFALKHCSIEQLQSGIEFLEKSRANRANYSYWTYLKNFRVLFLHPSFESRIAKIQKAITDRQAA